MAIITRLSLIATPGKTYTFIAKTELRSGTFGITNCVLVTPMYTVNLVTPIYTAESVTPVRAANQVAEIFSS